MRCNFCGFANGDDDHRCLRCGRRIGIAIAAPAGYSGANALAIAPSFEANETQDIEPVQRDGAGALAPSRQPRLFNAPPEKVIAFDDLQRRVAGKLPAQPAKAEQSTPVQRAQPRKTSTHVSRSIPEQTTMDFVPGSSFAPRMLKTAVPAQIYCDQPVATPTHRFVASLLDAAMIVLAFGLFVGAAEVTGGSFGDGRLFWIAAGSALVLISLFYGLIWAISARETAGMRWTDLQLITFDGHPVDARARASRVASTCLSFCSGGLGLIWAVADEESLTWHDHISKTFPTIRVVSKSFVRQSGRP